MAFVSGMFVQQGKAQRLVSASVNQTMDKYYALKNALAKDKAEEAQQVAVVLAGAVKEVPKNAFISAQHQQLWAAEAAVLQPQLALLAKSNDIKVQRKRFVEVSNSFVKLATGLKLSAKPVFVQYCPMAKASWLNEVKEVQNPYYGSMMYDCGEVQQVIAKK